MSKLNVITAAALLTLSLCLPVAAAAHVVIEGSTAKGALKAPLPVGAKVVLSGKDRHGHALRARFVKQ